MDHLLPQEPEAARSERHEISAISGPFLCDGIVLSENTHEPPSFGDQTFRVTQISNDVRSHANAAVHRSWWREHRHLAAAIGTALLVDDSGRVQADDVRRLLLAS